MTLKSTTYHYNLYTLPKGIFCSVPDSKMSDQMKKLIAELNKSPYNKSYNLISFDALSGEQLLQNLSDVMAEIDAKNKIDVREEEPETTILRILGMLRILKYKPPMEISQNFRQGLLEGHRTVILIFKFIPYLYQ